MNWRRSNDWRDMIPPPSNDWQWPPRWWGTMSALPTLTTEQWIERKRSSDE